MVEAKRNHKDLNQALSEAKSYADDINSCDDMSPAKFVTGIAGTPDKSFYTSTCYWDGKKWRNVSINNYDITGFLSPEQVDCILDSDDPHIRHYEADPRKFLKIANEINVILHDNGVRASERARLVSGLLLALAQDQNMQISNSPITLVTDVNGRIRALLDFHKKGEFLQEVELKLPNTDENHKKYRTAIVRILQKLREINIRSAINSGDDALGKFYETFLKYANDASEMGIVLTPRHITKFAVDVMDITPKDLIFDPTCGTGGFLVAALDHIREKYSTYREDVYKNFKNDCLFGVEEADGVFGLALVNMIFRGDGKSHIYNGNCFDNFFYKKDGKVIRVKKDDKASGVSMPAFSRILMNPPFAGEQDPTDFVDYALKQMPTGGRLFGILPNNPITGAKAYIEWRKQLLKENTIKACIKLPTELFLPNASKGTYAIIIERGRPHKADDLVLFACLFDQAHASNLSKNKSEIELQDNIPKLRNSLQDFMQNRNVENVPGEIAITKINMQELYDFAPEAYLADEQLRTEQLFASDSAHNLLKALITKPKKKLLRSSTPPSNEKEFSILDIFQITKGRSPALKRLRHGNIPVITTTETNNGIAGYYDMDGKFFAEGQITISANGSGGRAFYHPYRFAASTDVLVGAIKSSMPNELEFFLYICDVINRYAWHFNYYRKASRRRIEQDIKIMLPFKNNDFDIEYIKNRIAEIPVFGEIKKLIDETN